MDIHSDADDDCDNADPDCENVSNLDEFNNGTDTGFPNVIILNITEIILKTVDIRITWNIVDGTTHQ